MHKIIKILLLAAIFSNNSYLTAGQFQIKPTNNKVFERAEGFWSKPDDEKKEGFFKKLTDPKSQRENWYAVTTYIAEFWCAVSNAGFIYIGIKHNSPELIIAGLASFISHTIPKQSLNYVDKAAVALVLLKVIRERQILINNPWLIGPIGLLGLINATDAYLARNKAQTWPHVVWHLSAALVAHQFLNYTHIMINKKSLALSACT